MPHIHLQPLSRTYALVAALGLALFAAPSGAQTTHTINFDTDASGGVIADGTALTTQYADWGVTFEASPYANMYNTVSNGFFAPDTVLTITSTDVGPGYNPANGNILHAYGLSMPGWLTESGDPNFGIKFVNPVTDFALDMLEEQDGLSTLYIYDTNGNFEETVASPGTGGTETLSITPNGYAIGAVIVAPGWFGDYVAVDNIRFTSVPEPGSLALLAGSVVSGGLLLRRARKSRG